MQWLQGNYTDLYHECKNFTDCPIKSYNLCNGTGARECLTNFPTPDTCVPQGIYFSKDGGVRFPTIIDTENLNDDSKKFVCVSAQLN